MPLSSSKTLSPEEVVELAQAIMSPVAAPSSPDKATGLQRRKSTGGAASMSRKQSMSAVHKQSIELEPVDYVQMDEDTLLPFSDRPSQVAELLNNPVNADMLSQLKQAFRGTTSGSGSEPTAIRPNWKTIDVTEWTWDEFLAHLTTITRAECADYEWVLLARTAVRAHSVAVWERLGACLGCDSELITAGNEDEAGPAAWSGLGLGEEGEYDPALACVHIEALEAVDPAEDEEQEAALALEFGDPVPEDFESLWALSFTDSTPMETIGERDEQSSTSGSSTATSVKPALARPLLSPLSTGSATATGGSGISGIGNNCSRALSSSSAVSLTSATSDEGPRSPSGSRSFVGLQIMTSSSSDTDIAGLGSPPGSTFAKGFAAPQYERTPGNPLFVSSFNTLSLGPNLGRKASMVGSATAPTTDQIAPFRSSVPRRLSGTGLSESAVTFVTDLSF
jgi:hypothetical protein